MKCNRVGKYAYYRKKEEMPTTIRLADGVHQTNRGRKAFYDFANGATQSRRPKRRKARRGWGVWNGKDRKHGRTLESFGVVTDV